MDISTMFYILESIGIYSFALSGLILARSRNFDPVGMYIVALVTAFGGGTLRDLILDQHPVYWISHNEFPIIILGLTILYYLFTRIQIPPHTLIIPDALGLALFTISATQLSLSKNLPLFIVSLMAVMSATFGGLLRDVMCNDVPLIFKKTSLYASLTFLGSWLYIFIAPFFEAPLVATTLCVIFIFIARLISVRFNIRFN